MPPVLLEQLAEAFRGNGFADQVTLDLVALPALEHLLLGIGFHAFGNHLQPEFVRQNNRRGDDRLRITVVHHVCDKRLINLERVYRQSFQIAKRRIACAEIVDR